MLCLAVFDPDRDRRLGIKEMILLWLMGARRDIELLWFTDADPVPKLGTYSSDIHIALICADNPSSVFIGMALREENSACRILYYDVANADPNVLMRSMPSAFLTREDREAFFTVLNGVVDEALCSRAFFRFESKRDILMLPQREIVYFQSDLKRVNIMMNNGRTYTLNAKLDAVDRLLDADFVRIHKSYSVNRRYVCEIVKSDKTAILKNGGILPISDARYRETIDRFRSFKSL